MYAEQDQQKKSDNTDHHQQNIIADLSTLYQSNLAAGKMYQSTYSVDDPINDLRLH